MAELRSRTGGDEKPPDVPAPWKCRAETYWLLVKFSHPLPIGIYDALEATHPACTARQFDGGMGLISIVRYSDTPVGSYDELLIIPGRFEIPAGIVKGKAAARNTRIYVSQKATMYNGRKNWNIPKHLARFSFSAPVTPKGGSPPKELTVEVRPPKGANREDYPFFRATVSPVSYLPAFPLSSTWLPKSLMPIDSTLVQPPIPAGEDPAMPGTDVWRTFDFTASTKRAMLMWVKYEDIKQAARDPYWPPFVHPYTIGLWMEDATLEIGAPEEWKG